MNMYKIEIKNMIKGFLVWTITMICLICLFMAMFPSMSSSGMSEMMTTKMNAIPEAMRKSLGLNDLVNFSDLLQYFAYCAQYVLIGGCIYAGILGTNALIKEESEGTIEFLYAQPVSRRAIVLVKMLATFTILLLFNIAMFVSTVIFFEAFKKSGYSYFSNLTAMYYGMFVVELIFLFSGFAFSTILPKVSMATPAALSSFFITYLLGIFSSVISKLDWMKYLSPSQYVMPSRILKNSGNIEEVYIIISFVVIIISIAFTFMRYNRKDFKL